MTGVGHSADRLPRGQYVARDRDRVLDPRGAPSPLLAKEWPGAVLRELLLELLDRRVAAVVAGLVDDLPGSGLSVDTRSPFAVNYPGEDGG